MSQNLAVYKDAVPQQRSGTTAGRPLRRPMKLLLIVGMFAGLGIYRLRVITWLTDLWGIYMNYVTAYVRSGILYGFINFTDIGLLTPKPYPGEWQDLPLAGIIPYSTFSSFFTTIAYIEIMITAICILAAYSTLMLRRSYLAKIGAITLVLTGIFDIASPFPIIESLLGGIALFLLFRPEFKELYAMKEATSKRKRVVTEEKELTFKADLSRTRETRRKGIKCPKCGLLLPPSATVCRRCKTRIIEQ